MTPTLHALRAAALWTWALLRRAAVTAALACRHVPVLLFALARWRVLCCNMGMGRWTIKRRRGKSRRRPRGAPWITHATPTRQGFRFRVWLRRGDDIATLSKRIPAMEAAMRGTVRVRPVPGRHHRAVVTVIRRDPFRRPVPLPVALSPTRIRVGISEDGLPLELDWKLHPHWLSAGATGSGKSVGNAAILYALTMTPAALVLIDLKHGTSAWPMRARASEIAQTRDHAADLLGDLLTLGQHRAERLKAEGVDTVYELADPPREVYVIVDEISELAAGSTTEEKKAAGEAVSRLMRCVQLLRSFGIHVLVSGQRVGSMTGANVTSIRAQLSGRLCYRCDDEETARMTIGDLSSSAASAALSLNPARPGLAVATGGPDRWQVVRLAHVSHAALREQARAHAGLRVPWDELMAETRPVVRLEARGSLAAVARAEDVA